MNPRFWWEYFLLPATFTETGIVRIFDAFGDLFFQCPSLDAGLAFVDTALTERSQCLSS